VSAIRGESVCEECMGLHSKVLHCIDRRSCRAVTHEHSLGYDMVWLLLTVEHSSPALACVVE
jgi:hypothetical protein